MLVFGFQSTPRFNLSATLELALYWLRTMKPVTQEWTHALPMMQQTVLLVGLRGPDGTEKYSAVKMLTRWYRRCVVRSAMDGCVLENPYDSNGGSFTGPSIHKSDCAVPYPAPGQHQPEGSFDWAEPMNLVVDEYMKTQDSLPHHFQTHLMHSAEILGYKHPDSKIRKWWNSVYVRLVHSMHLHPETEAEMDMRLGDSRETWLLRADRATVA